MAAGRGEREANRLKLKSVFSEEEAKERRSEGPLGNNLREIHL